MALPGLYLPPYIVFRMSQECCFLARNLFFVPVCHLHILTQACTPHAAGRESWLLSQPRGGGWTLGPADPPGGLPSCQFSGQAMGEGHSFPAHKDLDPLEPAGRSSSRVPLGRAPGLREAVYPASLIAVRVHSAGLWCLQAGRPGSWPALQVRLSWGWLWSPSAAEQTKAGVSKH